MVGAIVLMSVLYAHHVFHILDNADCGMVAERIGADGAMLVLRNIVALRAIANFLA